MTKKVEPGITERDGRYQVRVWDPRARRHTSQTFDRLPDARRWRTAQIAEVDRGQRVAAAPISFGDYSRALVDKIERGQIRNRSSQVYRERVCSEIRRVLESHLLPELGTIPLGRVRRTVIQGLVDEWAASGLTASTVRNRLNVLRVIFREAAYAEHVPVNPCIGVRTEAVRGRRERAIDRHEARELIEALDRPFDRALWGVAFYAGLRRGEISDLCAEHVGEVEMHVPGTKSAAALRTVPIARPLRSLLDAYASPPEGRVFPGDRGGPFTPNRVQARADACWAAAGLDRCTLHEARHACASYFIAAGANAKTISQIMGHSSIQVTFDVYGHLFTGALHEAKGLVDTYLDDTP